MGRIFYIMGKSSSGKDTIYSRLLHDRELGLLNILLYTTRPIRQGESDGREYYFVDEKRFGQLRDAGKVIEYRTYETVHGPWTYFTADDGQVDLKAHNYLAIGTLESYENMIISNKLYKNKYFYIKFLRNCAPPLLPSPPMGEEGPPPSIPPSFPFPMACRRLLLSNRFLVSGPLFWWLKSNFFL